MVRPAGDGVVPVTSALVTLHRVGKDAAGPVDSIRTGRDGTYTFTFRRTGARGAVYFASSSYGGVAYFTSPFVADTIAGDDAEITVFDTTSRPVPITVRGRHLIVASPNAHGERLVTEVFDLSNDSSVTRTASGTADAAAVWTTSLPVAASAPKVGQGDVPAGGVTFRKGRALMFAPFGPGLRQLVITYTLPPTAFPLSTSAERANSVYEVLTEEPAATVSGAKLAEVQPVRVEGRSFRRFLASDVPLNAVATITVPEVREPVNAWFLVGLTFVIGGAMLGALAWSVRRR